MDVGASRAQRRLMAGASCVLLLACLASAAGCSLVLTAEGIVGGAPVDAGIGALCAAAGTAQDTSVVLCDDFDGPALAAAWSLPFEQNGSIRRSDEVFRSAPFALQTTTSSAGAGESPFAFYRAAFPALQGKRLRATLDVDVFVRQERSGADIVIAALEWRRDNDFSQIQVVLSNAGGATVLKVTEERILAGVEGFAPHAATAPFGRATWAHVRIDVLLEDFASASANRVSLSVNGTTVVDEALKQNLLDGVPDIAVGALWVSPSVPSSGGAFVLAHDNVVGRLAPL